MSKSTSEQIKFVEFCNVLEEIREARKHVVKEQKLEAFYNYYRKTGEQIKQNDSSADTSFFPMLRLLLPQLERQRPAFGLNKFSLRRILFKILGLSKDSDGFNRLGSGAYDFAESAYNLLVKQFNKSKNLSIWEINKYLDQIAEKQENNPSHREKMFLKLFQQTSPNEQKWILRIVLKKLGLGLSEIKILNTYHPDASALSNNTNNLETVCDTLTDRNVRINESGVALFTPIRPMLSKRCDAKELYKSVNDSKVFIIETKFDGERFQLHMENDRFKFFSRRGYDFTKTFGETYSVGVYTPLLKGVFGKNVKSVLLDGEMMGWNKTTKQFSSKGNSRAVDNINFKEKYIDDFFKLGMNFDVKHLSNTTIHQPCLCVFDILIFNDEVLSERPLRERVEILKDVFTPREGVIVHSIREEATTKQDIIKALNESMDKKEEGIVYKDPNSRYVPNDRNSGWWKLKLEYFSGVMTDLDVIIMGGFYGKGMQIDGFLVGVSTLQGNTRKIYLSLAKITSGLTSEEWKEIRKYLEPHWIKTVAENYENYGLNFGKMKPDVWVPPKKSCILLARATELIKIPRATSDFKTPYTMRFPRIESIRFDKPCEDCLTLTELEELTSSSTVHKLYNKHLRLEDLEYEMKKTKKFKPKFIDTNVHVDEQISDILKNYEFCVLSGSPDWKIDEVERAIKENGGDVVKAEGDNTYCILAGETHLRLEYYKGSVDVVKLSWLQRVLDERRICSYRPEDMIYVCERTKYKFLRTYDKYGDSYTDKATKSTLEYAFKKIAEKNDYVCPLPKEINELHAQMKFEKRLRVFHNFLVYFDKFKVINDPSSDLLYDSKLDELVVQFWGGTCNTALTAEVNLVIMRLDDAARRDEILAHDSCMAPVEVVDKSFLYEKIEEYENGV